jgi:hypothetical protein
MLTVSPCRNVWIVRVLTVGHTHGRGDGDCGERDSEDGSERLHDVLGVAERRKESRELRESRSR